MASKHRYTVTTSVVIRDVQIKTIMRYHYTLAERAQIKNDYIVFTRI